MEIKIERMNRMKCKKCGEWLPEGAAICANCGTEADNYEEIMQENITRFGMDKCEHCGYIGTATPEKMLRKRDWIILAITFISGFWIIYLIYIYFKRGDKSKRNMVCPSCGKVMKHYIDERTLQEIFKDDASANKAKTVATNIANNPELRKEVAKSIKDIKKSFRDFQDTL